MTGKHLHVGDVLPGLFPSTYTPDMTKKEQERRGKARKRQRLDRPPMRATVVYIHPERRFVTVEFDYGDGYKFRESFLCGRRAANG